jgi:prophage tail gpP-like protein
MSLAIQRNGENYINFKNAMCRVSMENVCGHFNFTSTPDENSAFPVKIGDVINVLADDIKVMTGYVEALTASDDRESNDILLSGRGKLCDLVDSTLKEPKEYSGKISLAYIAETVLADIGLDTEVIEDFKTPPELFEEWDIESPEIGQSGFDFIEKLARKRQVLLTSDKDGNLVLTRASDTIFPVQLKKKKGGQDNNVLSSSLTIDHSKVFNKIFVAGQLNPINQAANVRPKDLVSILSSAALNSKIRTSRQLVINSEESSDGFTANQRAIWEANIRRARSLTYTATVQGHSVNGQLWTPNVIVSVDDDFKNLHGNMRIKNVTYLASLDEGSTTRPELTYKDAYSLQAEQDARDALDEDW